jgi:hypothetical protein
MTRTDGSMRVVSGFTDWFERTTFGKVGRLAQQAKTALRGSSGRYVECSIGSRASV